MYPIKDVFRLFNLSEQHAVDSFVIGVLHWARIMGKGLKSTPLEKLASALPSLLSSAWKKTHIRCHAVENLLDWAAVVGSSEMRAFEESLSATILIIEFGFRYSGARGVVARKFFDYEREHAGQLDCMTVVWTPAEFKAHASDRYAWRDFTVKSGWPVAMFYAEDHQSRSVPTEAMTPADIEALEDADEKPSRLLSGQQAAFNQLLLMLQARREGLSAAGVSPRLHSLILGPSGSGKTHVVRCFAAGMGLPIYEQSAGSWLPLGARVEESTARKLAQFVQTNDEGIIYIDEVEKPFPASLMNGSTWDRANADELMSLLDAKTAAWEGWSARLSEKLDKRFFVILSGAWQDAYLQAFRVHELLGGDWSNLSIVDGFLDDNHLPAELLNRVSTNLIEVLPPSRGELGQMILAVQRDLNMPQNEAEAHRVADEIIADRKGMRGIESYMLRSWMLKNSPSPTTPPASENLEFDF